MKPLNCHIIIAGLARDCAHNLPALLASLSELAKQFKNSSFIFLENDSIDRSKKILADFATSHPNCQVEFHDKIGKIHPKRTDRLAVLRNRILDIANNLPANKEKAYFLLLDLDGANSDINIKKITSIVSHDTGDWTGLFANQRLNYYDLWALRHPKYCPYDIWEKVRNRPPSMSKEDAINRFITANRFALPEDGGLIEVESAFGGIGLYRFDAVKDCRYIGLDESGNQICEHVAFNAAIRTRGGKLFIDSGWINSDGDELHAPVKSNFRRKAERFMKRVNRIHDRAMKCLFNV